MRKASTSSGFASGLADCGLLVMAGHVMESDSISVKVIQDGETELITLSIVRLRPLGSKMCSRLFPPNSFNPDSDSPASVGPVDTVV